MLSPILLDEIFNREYLTDTSGLKLHVHKIYKFSSSGKLLKSERYLPEYEEVDMKSNDVYYLDKGAYIVRYKEYIKIPANTIALTIPRSSLLRMGATIHTAVWDAGYEGQGVGLLIVFNENGIYISREAHIAQLVFFKILGESILYNGVYKGERE